MPTILISSGPHKDLKFTGHADADSYDKQAGQVGACVEAADANDIYRSALPAAHEKFVTILAKSGIPRGVNKKGTDAAKQRAKDPSKVEDVPETYTTYANRVKALLESGTVGQPEGTTVTDAMIADGKARWAALDAEVHAVELVCDSSPTARQKGPDKAAVAKAEEILARSDDAMEATITKLLNEVNGYDLVRDEDGKPDRMSLARLVAEFVKASV